MGNRPFNYDYDCSREALLERYEGRDIRLSPDIMGIGVLIGFAGSTIIAVLLIFVKYIIAFDPLARPVSCSHSTETLSSSCGARCRQERHWKPNPIDRAVLSIIRRWTTPCQRNLSVHVLARTIDECILDMCDIQAITGLAILSSGFASLSHATAPLTASDWQTVVLLAWFSASTHMAGSTCLREHFSTRPRLKISRLLLMALVLVSLLVAMIPTGFFDWTFFWNNMSRHPPLPLSPAICYFNYSTAYTLWAILARYGASLNEELAILGAGSMQSMLFSMALLIFGFVIRCIKLFPTLSHGVFIYGRQPISRFFRQLLSVLIGLSKRLSSSISPGSMLLAHLWTDLVILPVMGLYLCLRWTADIYSSVVAEILWVIFLTLWGFMKLLSTRITNGWLQKLLDAESADLDTWNFGQIIAVVLLASPLFTIARKFLEEKSDSQQLGSSNSRPYLPEQSQGEAQPEHQVLLLVELESQPARRDFGNLGSSALPPRGSHGLVRDMRNRTTRKLDFVQQLVVADLAVRTRWVVMCQLLACYFWIITASLTSAFTNHFIAVQWGKAPNTTTEGRYTIAAFWFTHWGMLWTVIFCYPATTALVSAVAAQMEVARASTRRPVALPLWALFLLSGLCLATQAAAFCIPYYMYKLLSLSPLKYPRWLRYAIENLFLTVLYYVAYILLSIGILICQARRY
ncbi:hypothetical protein MN608_05493 [Microdochium nivale]|nr:hypothetical protein MN608_05493 [Microdochium nivale]